MKIWCFLLLIAICYAVPTQKDWDSFKVSHKKKYQSNAEDKKRQEIYQQNQQVIDEHNQKYEKGLVTFIMKMNRFGDLTQQEFQRLYDGFIMDQTQQDEQTSQDVSQYVSNEQDTPQSVDWSQKGAVTGVKNQGQCGSCWAFSATGCLEGQYFKKTGKLVALSEQQLMDCSTKYGNNGCQGGSMKKAFKYIRDKGGIQAETSYPYYAEDRQCHFKKELVVTTVDKIISLPNGEESQLQNALAFSGPVSAAFDATHQSFHFYSRGIYSEANCSTNLLSHGVLAVGYGEEENGQQYWLVKNSWGPEWGEQGYFRLARNKNNMCGIATMASYVEVN